MAGSAEEHGSVEQAEGLDLIDLPLITHCRQLAVSVSLHGKADLGADDVTA